MKTPVLTLIAVGALSVVYAATAFAGSSALDVSGTVSAIAPLNGGGVFLEEPATAAVAGIGQLPTTSTADNLLAVAIGTVLMAFGVAALALRAALAKR